MAATITIDQVKEFYPTSLSDSVIAGLITFVAQADACLDANQVPDDIQTVLKLNAIAHSLMQIDGGQVTSERSMTGAAVTFKETGSKFGINSTPYGQVVASLDLNGCLTSLYKSQRFLKSIGR